MAREIGGLCDERKKKPVSFFPEEPRDFLYMYRSQTNKFFSLWLIKEHDILMGAMALKLSCFVYAALLIDASFIQPSRERKKLLLTQIDSD